MIACRPSILLSHCSNDSRRNSTRRPTRILGIGGIPRTLLFNTLERCDLEKRRKAAASENVSIRCLSVWFSAMLLRLYTHSSGTFARSGRKGKLLHTEDAAMGQPPRTRHGGHTRRPLFNTRGAASGGSIESEVIR